MTTALIAPDLKLQAPCHLEFRFNKLNQVKEFYCGSEFEEFRDYLCGVIDRAKKSELSILDFIKTELNKGPFGPELYCVFTGLFTYFYPNQTYSIDTENMLCRCFGVSRHEVTGLISGGAKDLLTITNLTKAGGGCGSCLADIRPLISGKNNELDIAKVTFQNYKRDLVANKRPYQFLKEDLFPFVSTRKSIKIEGLIGHHLYLEGDENSTDAKEIISFVKSQDENINIFFI